jgi:hypothetical protein
VQAGQVCERGQQSESMCKEHEKPDSEQRDKSGNSGGWTSMRGWTTAGESVQRAGGARQQAEKLDSK